MRSVQQQDCGETIIARMFCERSEDYYHSQGGTYWVRSDWETRHARVHEGACQSVVNGLLVADHRASAVYFNWLGPYDTIEEAIDEAYIHSEKVYGCMSCGTVNEQSALHRPQLTSSQTPTRNTGRGLWIVIVVLVGIVMALVVLAIRN